MIGQQVGEKFRDLKSILSIDRYSYSPNKFNEIKAIVKQPRKRVFEVRVKVHHESPFYSRTPHRFHCPMTNEVNDLCIGDR